MKKLLILLALILAPTALAATVPADNAPEAILIRRNDS